MEITYQIKAVKENGETYFVYNGQKWSAKDYADATARDCNNRWSPGIKFTVTESSEVLKDEIPTFAANTTDDKGAKVRAIFEHFGKLGYTKQDINSALSALNF